ncbi:unnamed protein product [Sympodiomycopsis kandeliae]
MKFSVKVAVLAGAIALTKNAVLAQGVVNSDDAVVTSADNIVSALLATNQTEGVPADAYPAEPVEATEVATNSSDVVDNSARRRSLFQTSLVNKGNVAKRNTRLAERSREWTTVFDGTVPGNEAISGAAVQMPAYLTYSVVSNTSDYSVAKAKCLSFCEKTDKCASANLYYEYNNPLLDWVFGEKSNLKCALYGDIPTLNQFTNKGGQQQKPKPEPVTYIAKSSAFANPYPLQNVATPSGYTLSYGPTNGANNDPTYMTYKFLTQYDPAACAKICDSTKGCSSFNIWRGVVNGDPRTYTCSLYSGFVDASTAVNTGDAVNKVVVTYSRGYVSTAAKAAADKAAADKAAADKAAADKAAADKAAADKAAADAAAAKAKCVSDNAGFQWIYIPRNAYNQYQCIDRGVIPTKNDISELKSQTSNLASLAVANGQSPSKIYTHWGSNDAGQTYRPFNAQNDLSSAGFTIFTKGYFVAPTTGDYTFTLDGDDIARAWFGDNAKSGFTADNADMSISCSDARKVMTLQAGSLTPIRTAGTNGPGQYTLGLTILDPTRKEVSDSWIQDTCDGDSIAFPF